MECVLDKTGLNNEEKKQLKHSLSMAVAYLKGLFRSHVSTEESKCPSHCRKFALRNPTDKDLVSAECDHQHDEVCSDCENVFQCLDDFHDYVVNKVKDETVKEELLYDIKLAAMYIMDWMRHILRGAHTQDTKRRILEAMDESSAFLIGDWMMKFLPQYFCEKMKNWFGKRGISGHVHSFIMKNGDNFKKATYFTFVDTCPQNGYTSTCLFENDLRAFLVDFQTSSHSTAEMTAQLATLVQQY